MSNLESEKGSQSKGFTGKCMDCGKEYSLTDGEIGFYQKHDLFRPKRCVSCRQNRRPCCDPMKTAMRNGAIQRWKGGIALVLNDKELLPVVICPFGCGREYPKPSPHIVRRKVDVMPESMVEPMTELEPTVDAPDPDEYYPNLPDGPDEYNPNA